MFQPAVLSNGSNHFDTRQSSRDPYRLFPAHFTLDPLDFFLCFRNEDSIRSSRSFSAVSAASVLPCLCAGLPWRTILSHRNHFHLHCPNRPARIRRQPFAPAPQDSSYRSRGTASSPYSSHTRPGNSRCHPAHFYDSGGHSVQKISVRETMIIVPGKSCNASSNTSLDAMSRWLVGSSIISRFAPESMSFSRKAALSLRRSAKKRVEKPYHS